MTLRSAVRHRYGGWRGLLHVEGARVRAKLGAWRAERRIAWARVDVLVFVCTGNICRSAYAGARTKELELPVASCGIEALADRHADPGALAAGERRGTDLRVHRTQNIVACAETLVGAGQKPLWVCMEPHHLARVRALYPEDQATLLGLWDVNGGPVIPDPFGGEGAQFDWCFDRIDACLTGLLADRSN